MKYLTILIAALCAALPASAKENRGDAIPRMCYRSFWPQEKYNRQFAETGVKLVFIYPANTDCTLKLPYSNYPTIWTGPNQYNWDSLDRHIGDVLKWNPGAKLIVMIDLNTPKWWNDAHGGTDSFRKLSDALLSEDYRRDVTEYVRRFLEYTESKYKDDIVAYHLAAGLCCEWFDSIKGRTTPRKDAEFGRMMGCPGMVVPKDVHKTTHPLFYDPVKDADKLAYWKWHHKITGDAAIAFAEDARRVINDRVPIGLFFGYMMAHGKDKLLQWGHLEYDRVFQSPAFGAVSAPAVYHHRGMGGTSGFQFCPDSILANGNILWQEIDHVTHVLKDTKKQGARQRSGGGKRLDFNTLEQTIVGLRREFALGMISGSHIWWFDMFGSWFDSPEVMAEIKHFNELAEQYADTGPDKAAEVAYFADAESMYYVNGHCPLGDMVLRQTQFNLFRSGVPWRCYSLPDLEHVDLSQFKVIILPNLFVLTPEKRELLEKTVLRDGKTVVTLFAPGIITNNKYDVTNIGKFTGIPVQRLRKPEESQKATYAKRDGWTSVFLGRPLATPELWRYIFRKAGVHIYNTDDEAFYANEEFVAIHTAKGGERTIRLPRPCRVTEVFENRVVSEKPVTEFTDTLPAPGTRMYHLAPVGTNKKAAISPSPEQVEDIVRTIDVSKTVRPFPNLIAHRNTSIQKVPAPALAELAEREFGKAKITRCWLNLDEMWDYRTRKYDYNYRIGASKYDDVPEKHRETWDWVTESNVHMDDYLKAFGNHSDAVMLCIRRYERDVLDGKLGVTMEDWKAIFKSAVKHAKEVCPNVRYIEVCNEYGAGVFIGCTADEYYRFYRLAYEAVNEVNAELKLTDAHRLLVGGPNVVCSAIPNLDRFFANFSKDPSPNKLLDFVSWHEYHNKYDAIAKREEQVKGMLAKHGLPEDLPLFITEHDPYHPSAESKKHNLINGAALVKSLYFAARSSPGMKIFPWVLYHDGNIQTRFMWFEGPNEPDTSAEELRMLPSGCSMKLLGMHENREIDVNNAVEVDELVLASAGDGRLVVQAVNYGEPRAVRIRLDNLPAVFSDLTEAKVRLKKYLIDRKHSNCVDKPEYPGGIEKVEDAGVRYEKGSIVLEHPSLEKDGMLLWEMEPLR